MVFMTQWHCAKPAMRAHHACPPHTRSAPRNCLEGAQAPLAATLEGVPCLREAEALARSLQRPSLEPQRPRPILLVRPAPSESAAWQTLARLSTGRRTPWHPLMWGDIRMWRRWKNSHRRRVCPGTARVASCCLFAWLVSGRNTGTTTQENLRGPKWNVATADQDRDEVLL